MLIYFYLGGHLSLPNSAPNLSASPYQINHHPQQVPPYSMPPHSYHQTMPPSASMPLTVAALSGSSPASNVPHYSQQQQMMHQQRMIMMHQQQQLQQQLHQQSKVVVSSITTGIQCDFCGGNEQENKTTKLPEQMITCKVIWSENNHRNILLYCH